MSKGLDRYAFPKEIALSIFCLTSILTLQGGLENSYPSLSFHYINIAAPGSTALLITLRFLKNNNNIYKKPYLQ